MNENLKKASWMGEGDFVENRSNSDLSIGEEVKPSFEKSTENNENLLLFDIIESKIIDDDENPDKKYVMYTVRIRHGTPIVDMHITSIERRYTDFLKLYDGLRKDHPDKLNNFYFPRKAIVGNFSIKLINERQKKFEEFLTIIAQDITLRNSSHLLNFLQERELKKALEYFESEKFELAEPLLTSNFRLLNKVYTDRSHSVLLALCRLVCCCEKLNNDKKKLATKWAMLAVQRYDGVSDSDLLSLYGPLLETSIKLLDDDCEHKKLLTERLESMRRRGINLKNMKLIDAINKLDNELKSLN